MVLFEQLLSPWVQCESLGGENNKSHLVLEAT